MKYMHFNHIICKTVLMVAWSCLFQCNKETFKILETFEILCWGIHRSEFFQELTVIIMGCCSHLQGLQFTNLSNQRNFVIKEY